MKTGRKAQGHDMSNGSAGTKRIAHGMGHVASGRCPAKKRVRRKLERRVRQAGRKACRDY